MMMMMMMMMMIVVVVAAMMMMVVMIMIIIIIVVVIVIIITTISTFMAVASYRRHSYCTHWNKRFCPSIPNMKINLANKGRTRDVIVF